MKSNKLKLNPHLMTPGKSQRLRLLPKAIEMRMDGILLTESLDKSEALLGCQIQANRKWQKQVQVLLVKLRTRLVGLTKIKYVVPSTIRKTITEGIFNSVLVYCLPLFGGMYNWDLKDLQVLTKTRHLR